MHSLGQSRYGTIFPQCGCRLDQVTARAGNIIRGFTEGDRSYSVADMQFQGAQLQCRSAHCRHVSIAMPPVRAAASAPRRPARARADRHGRHPARPPRRSRPQAHKLIEAVRELVEVSQGTVTVEPAAAGRPSAASPAGPEVRMLTGSRQVLLDGELLPLTRLEFDLLLFLAERPRRVFTRGQLLAGVWGYEHTGERTVDVHVRRLRLKLGGALPVITTVYGVGYRLSDDARVRGPAARVACPARARASRLRRGPGRGARRRARRVGNPTVTSGWRSTARRPPAPDRLADALVDPLRVRGRPAIRISTADFLRPGVAAPGVRPRQSGHVLRRLVRRGRPGPRGARPGRPGRLRAGR